MDTVRFELRVKMSRPRGVGREEMVREEKKRGEERKTKVALED